MFSQVPVILSHRIRQRSVVLRSLNKPLSLAELMSYRFFCLLRLSSLGARRWLALDNAPSFFTSRINYVLARCKLRYFLFADVTGFRIPRPAFLTGIVLIVPTMGEIDFYFPKKSRGKKFSEITVYTPANEYPVVFVMCCISIHSYWVTYTNVA